MKMLIYKTIVALSVTALPLIIDIYFKWHYKKRIKKIENLQRSNSFYYHCLFWTVENEKCRKHVYNNEECENNCSVSSLKTLTKFISSAKYSISMCMYHLTLRSITDELIHARNRGVTVRLITDTVTSKINHSKFKLLKNKFGFDVRTPHHNDTLMHHKYCVIDGKNPELGKIFLGSLNLTLQGSVANFECVILTNNHEIVTNYEEEFDRLWQDFEQY